MDGNLSISLDKLPVKRLEIIEENGAEKFPPYEHHHFHFPQISHISPLQSIFWSFWCNVCSDLSYDDNRVNQIRRIDFAWAVEREDPNKKQKKGDSTASSSKDTTSSSTWPWKKMVENLNLRVNYTLLVSEITQSNNLHGPSFENLTSFVFMVGKSISFSFLPCPLKFVKHM